ncbi:MAG TPA: hypothetical protein VNW92_10030 [Polyangiaceae bacterium]|nr:hypothetical protein [Polyangiaceae bacterium]
MFAESVLTGKPLCVRRISRDTARNITVFSLFGTSLQAGHNRRRFAVRW